MAKKPKASSKPVVIVGLFQAEPSGKGEYFRLFPDAQSGAYYRIPRAAARLEPGEPKDGQAVTVRISDASTPIEHVQTVEAKFFKGPIAAAYLGRAMIAREHTKALSLVPTLCPF